jgi:phenylalanine-4-hydroxylase
MSTIDRDLAKIAARHGVDLAQVETVSRSARLEELQKTIARTDVPYPIAPELQKKYLEDCQAGKLFGVGTLSSDNVDLSQYADFQDYEKYSLREHLSWACLVADQQRTKHQFACHEYLQGESIFEIGGTVIPDYYMLNARIYQQTRWQLATVNMIIPAELFFTCHSKRFFPVTTFMRDLEVDYLEEPDIGHDIAGHVATFTIPAVADVMKNHGDARDLIYTERDQKLASANDPETVDMIKAEAEELLSYAGRIYWFTVEFGLVMQDSELRGFGAGILSSPGETTYSIQSPKSNRILIDPSDDYDLLRLATTDYLISEFQKTYFVMSSFDQVQSLTAERILAASKRAMELPHYTWREIIPGDKIINVGQIAVSTNEKYMRLMLDMPVDDCLTRSAIRNLRMHLAGLPENWTNAFRVPPDSIPEEAIEWFKQQDVIPRT